MHDYTMLLAHPLIPVGERRRATSWFKSKPWPIRWVSLSNPKSPTLSCISTSLDELSKPILVQTTGIWQNILEEDSTFYFFKVFSNNLNILLYSSVQLLGCTNPWSSTG